MHVVLPLLLTSLSINLRSDSSRLNNGVRGVHKVKVPYSSHEDLEEVVVGDKRADELVVLDELLELNTAVGLEGLGDVVMGGEHVVEFVSAFFNCLSSSLNIRVSARIKLLLNLIHLQSSISISIQLLKGLLNQSNSKLRQLP